MKKSETDKGWVVASMNGTFIITYSFAKTRSESIKKWMSLWDKDRCNWRKFKRQGYKCVRAEQRTDIIE